MSQKIKSGVATGDTVQEIFQLAKEKGFALPAANVISSSTINAVIEAAKELNAPVIVQFSNGGAHFNAGKGLSNEGQKAAIAGGVAGAKHVHVMAKAYDVPVILHTDHCAKKLLPWIDGLLDAGEAYFKENGVPLFSSHMIDLSEEPIEENIEICKGYLERTRFTIAASFGNVHGVYKPGNVKLTPKILDNSQKYIEEKYNTGKNPVDFVFHGGSGSSLEEIREAIGYGVIKMNIDTDLQYAYMAGVRDYMDEKSAYLKGQIGNPDGADSPNKKFYDPRVWVRKGEDSFKARIKQAFEDLNNVDTL